ncbi:hypothetical protein GQ54DRAFT_297808 [Martensiomyces pterosporus]|nr:hypothetical protein GQ54DRAFT_297808 [Martensiomyces pterosporus]
MASSDKSFKAFEAYSFGEDEAFQAGLKTIPGSDDAQKMEQIKWFYYTKTIESLDRDAYLEWKARAAEAGDDNAAANGELAEASGAMVPGAPYSASFAEVVGMIMRGEEIPGIRQIPDELNENEPSVSVAKAPPKPWEVRSPQQD